MIFRKHLLKKSLKLGLLEMDPMPVVKRNNFVCVCKRCPSFSSHKRAQHTCPHHSGNINNEVFACTSKRSSRMNQQRMDTFCPLHEFDYEIRCSICSEIFIKATTLNCSHTFCEFCIKKWKQKNEDCPVCRANITFQVHTLVVDNIIEKILKILPIELQEQRAGIIAERRKTLEAEQRYEKGAQITINTPTRTNVWNSRFRVSNA